MTHQTTVGSFNQVPLASPTSTDHRLLRGSPLPIPSPSATLPPIQLFQTLASNTGIQSYLEDSQFGLLMSTLTLAGAKFVVDIDLEMDGSDDPDDDDGNADERRSLPRMVSEDDPFRPAGAFPRGTSFPSKNSAVDLEGRGRVRLSKLTVNRVTADGATVAGTWIETVLKEHVGRYLRAWNSGSRGYERGVTIEKTLRALERELQDLNTIDKLVAGGETCTQSLFEDLEVVAKEVERFTAAKR